MKIPHLDADGFAFLLWRIERAEPLTLADLLAGMQYSRGCAKERYQLLKALKSGYLVHQQQIENQAEKIAELEQALREARERISA